MKIQFSRKTWIYAAFIAVSIGAALFYFHPEFSPKATSSRSHATLNNNDKCRLESGDIILRRGEGLVSDEISYILKDQPYDITHSGIIIKQGDSLFVVHSIADHESHVDGVIAQELDKFLLDSRAGSVIVLRYNDMEGKQDALVQRVLYYLKKSPPFDFSFDIYDSSKLYCAELLWRIFGDVFHTDIFPIKIHTPTTDLLCYSSLFKGDSFRIIINQQKL